MAKRKRAVKNEPEEVPKVKSETSDNEAETKGLFNTTITQLKSEGGLTKEELNQSIPLQTPPIKSEQDSGATPKKSKRRNIKDENGDHAEIEKEEKIIGLSPAKRLAEKLKYETGESPFPTFAHPTPIECKEVLDALAKEHGMPKRVKDKELTNYGKACGEVPDVLEALVRTILSQNTSNSNSSRAMSSLCKVFSDETLTKLGEQQRWIDVYEAPEQKLVEAIQSGGLANIKARRIKNILQSVKDKHGKITLNHLYDSSNAEAKEELMAFDGVGPKTASCVLLFCLNRESFAVDTHVFRLSKALNWIPQKSNREQAHAHLDLKVPDDFKYPLHILLIKHGKKCGKCMAMKRGDAGKSGCCLGEFKK